MAEITYYQQISSKPGSADFIPVTLETATGPFVEWEEMVNMFGNDSIALKKYNEDRYHYQIHERYQWIAAILEQFGDLKNPKIKTLMVSDHQLVYDGRIRDSLKQCGLYLVNSPEYSPGIKVGILKPPSTTPNGTELNNIKRRICYNIEAIIYETFHVGSAGTIHLGINVGKHGKNNVVVFAKKLKVPFDQAFKRSGLSARNPEKTLEYMIPSPEGLTPEQEKQYRANCMKVIKQWWNDCKIPQ